jgi:hypothetical protein
MSARFFYRHAGFSYDPATETREQGRRRRARMLAQAERDARVYGLSFAWNVDPDVDSSDWSDDRPAWQVWECHAMNRDGDMLACLGGIDFGRDGSPEGEAYARVVEAELAQEAMGAIMRATEA